MSWQEYSSPNGRIIARHLERELRKLLFERVDRKMLLKIGRDAVRRARDIVDNRIEIRYGEYGPEVHVWFRPKGKEEYHWLRAIVGRPGK